MLMPYYNNVTPFQLLILAFATPLIVLIDAVTASTTVKVPLDVNVWIVFPPDVVIVPPVEESETPSEPSVAYEIITIPEPPA